MNEIAVFDLISILSSVTGLVIIFIIQTNKLSPDIKWLLFILFIFMMTYSFFLFVEWYGIFDKVEAYEDLFSAIMPLIWAFLFYAFIQRSQNVDLTESKKQLNMALKGTRAGLWDWYVQSGMVIINERWAEMLGYGIEELEPVSFDTWTRNTHPDDLKKSNELLQKHFKGETAFYECEARMKHKHGHWIWVIDRGMVIEWDEHGNPVRLTGTLIEITRQKLVEKELKAQIEKNEAINKNYEVQNKKLTKSLKRIKSINHELRLAKKKAEESDRLKSSFLANISHEIRTPMNGIMGFAELLKQPDLEDDQHKEYTEIIEQSGNRMLNIIDDLIDISKIEAGQVDIKYESVNVRELLNDLYLFFHPESEKKHVKLSFSLNLPVKENIIVTDKTKLHQILSNIIKNALKYTDEGYIDFGCSRVDQFIEFFVRDTGIGISPDARKTIFERFRQVNLNFTSAREGYGLGLTISKAYVEKLNGKIWLQSTPGKGSIFYFTIPYMESKTLEKTDQSSSDYPENGNFSNATILVAEDDDISFTYLYEILSARKVKLIRARNGKEAIDLYKKHPEIDIILMDIKMPVMDGYESAKKIKSINNKIPVILQTAYTLNKDKEEMTGSEIEGYLTKPIRVVELLNMLGKFIVF